MAIHLNHTIVPAKDKEASARFFAHVMGLTYEGASGHFAPVRVDDNLTMDFDSREDFEHHQVFDSLLKLSQNYVKSRGQPDRRRHG